MSNIDLIKAYKSGDSEARTKLIEKNKGLVFKIALKYRGEDNRNEFEDLVQEGLIGLMKAIENFDESQGTEFSTYAVWWIKHGIMKSLYNYSRSIRIPIHTIVEINKIKKAMGELAQRLNRTPKIDDVAVYLKLEAVKVKELLEYDRSIVSMDAPLTDKDGEYSLSDVVPDSAASPDEVVTGDIFNQEVRELLEKTLDDREKGVIKHRYGFQGDPLTLEKVGGIYNMSKERVRSLESNALRKLRKTPMMMRYKREHYIDEMTLFYRRGAQPVESAVMYREMKRRTLSLMNDPIFYKWGRELKKQKLSMDNQLVEFTPEQQASVDYKYKCLERAVLCVLWDTDNQEGYSIIRQRLSGASEEDVRMYYYGTRSYREAESSALKLIHEELARLNINININ